MKIQQIRHATLMLNINDKLMLVDPMLSKKGEMEPVLCLTNPSRNPLVDLPFDDSRLQEILKSIDAVLVTHTHRDHFDDAAAKLLPKEIPLICQPEDEAKFTDYGFTNLFPVKAGVEWEGISFTRTGGHHGKGEVEKELGTVSGFFIKAQKEPSVYIAGDTVWCSEVGEALGRYSPDVTVVNAGAARLLTGGPITMDKEDISGVCRRCPGTSVVAVHMEAFNHCGLKRDMLGRHLEKSGLGSRVVIPADGEWLEF